MHAVENMMYQAKFGIPWHKLGVQVDDWKTAEESLIIAKANYEVVKVPVYFVDPHTDTHQIVPGKVATARPNPEHDENDPTSTALQVLGIVSEDYPVHQHLQLLRFAEALVEVTNEEAGIDTVGVLNNGRRFFAYLRARSARQFTLANGATDELITGIGIITDHAGGSSTHAFGTDIRSVCANTVEFGMADATRGGRIISIRHDIDMDDPECFGLLLAQARQVVEHAGNRTARIIEEAKELSHIGVSDDDFRTVQNSMWPENPDASDLSKKLRARRHERMLEVFRSDTNVGLFGANGWTAVQAITEYMDHHRRGNEVARAKASVAPWKNQANTVKVTAAATVRALAEAR